MWALSTNPRCWMNAQFDDLREIFPTLVLFGDPAQLAPVGPSGEMVFDQLGDGPQADAVAASTGRRRTTRSWIWRMRWAMTGMGFEEFERWCRQRRATMTGWSGPNGWMPDLMARCPVLVWRNATRIRLIQAFRDGAWRAGGCSCCRASR